MADVRWRGRAAAASPDTARVCWVAQGYEPYVLMSRRYVPWYDERFRGYGWDKIVFILDLAGAGFAAPPGSSLWTARLLLLPLPFCLAWPLYSGQWQGCSTYLHRLPIVCIRIVAAPWPR